MKTREASKEDSPIGYMLPTELEMSKKLHSIMKSDSGLRKKVLTKINNWAKK